jgi:hypothetical protein
MMLSLERKVRCKKGQELIELVLILHLMIALAFGAIEVGSVISTYLTITHTSREGANLISRGTEVNLALDAVEAAAAPTIRTSNQAQWNIIYSKLILNPAVVPACTEEPCEYVVAPGQVTRGNLGKSSLLCGTSQPCGDNNVVTVSGINSVKPPQSFIAVEVFYDYAPNIITYVGKGINTDFYERTIFTNLSS